MLVAFIATTIIGALLYKIYFSKPKDFWKKHGIPEINTSPILGVMDILLSRKTMSVADDYAYSKMGPNDKFCGIYDMGSPVLLIKDMELVKKVLIKDFDYFVDRRQVFAEQDGSLYQSLVALKNDEWKGVRSSVSPAFTTGKIRKMQNYFNIIGMNWVAEYTKRAKSTPSGSTKIDVLKAVNQYTVDVISTTVFGMNADSIKNPNSTFFKYSLRIADYNLLDLFKFVFRLNVPWLGSIFKFRVTDLQAVSFFEEILDQGLKSRLSGETKRNDFLQLLVEAKKGELKSVEKDELSSFEKDAQISADFSNKKQYLTQEIMNAQSILFFFAGFSNTSNLITFVLYVLALHPTVQQRLRQEVNKIVKEDGSFDYDDVGQLTYLDMLICETLRVFPAALRLERICTEEYRDPESGLVVPKGTLVGIPINGFHHDKQYYENPDEFYPEHFTPEKKTARNPYAFLPFGSGPRNCIGMRFALIEVKSAIAHMVHGFKIEPTEKTPTPLQSQPAGLQVIPPKKLELKLTPIKNSLKFKTNFSFVLE